MLKTSYCLLIDGENGDEDFDDSCNTCVGGCDDDAWAGGDGSPGRGCVLVSGESDGGC